jgi:hypothetical protein
MKKTSLGAISIVLLFSLIFSSLPRHVSAEGNWVLPQASASTTFTTVNLDEAVKTAPSWQHLFSDGIEITAPTKICYSFPRGEHKWVPKFYQYKNDEWTSIKTTTEYLNGEEGGLFVCAQPDKAGTYALFAYYNGPAENKTASSVSCEEITKNWYADLTLVSTEVFNFVAHLDNINQAGVSVSYSLGSFAYGASSFVPSSLSGSGVTEVDGSGSKVVFSNPIPNDPWSLRYTLSAQGCSVTQPLTIVGN